MTNEQKAALDRVFRRYGSQSSEWNQTIYFYHTRADQLHTCNSVAYEDKRTIDDIKELERMLESLTAHRAALAERYAELATAPTVPVVKLTRRKMDTVTYYLETFDRNLNDNHDERTSFVKYPGTQRHKAIADYREYVRTHPGIIASMDIKKPERER